MEQAISREILQYDYADKISTPSEYSTDLKGKVKIEPHKSKTGVLYVSLETPSNSPYGKQTVELILVAMNGFPKERPILLSRKPIYHLNISDKISKCNDEKGYEINTQGLNWDYDPVPGSSNRKTTVGTLLLFVHKLFADPSVACFMVEERVQLYGSNKSLYDKKAKQSLA